MRFAAVLALGAILFLGACGDDDDDEPASGATGEIAVEADAPEDRQIGEDLRTYIDRNLKPGGPAQAVFDELCANPKNAQVERDCALALEAQAAGESVWAISVEEGRIELSTDLSQDDQAGAKVLCDTIQGADVADFTPGHTILGEEGEEIAVCEVPAK
jgi:hypothetical protein